MKDQIWTCLSYTYFYNCKFNCILRIVSTENENLDEFFTLKYAFACSISKKYRKELKNNSRILLIEILTLKHWVSVSKANISDRSIEKI